MFCEVKCSRKIFEIQVERIKNHLGISSASEKWLNECQLSISPCGRVIVVGKNKSLILCHLEHESEPYKSNVNQRNVNDLTSWQLTSPLTALLVFTVSSKSHRQCLSDWICVAVGCESGEVKFFSDQGRLLLSEKVDTKPVLEIKCFTGCYSNDVDEFYIIFNDSICNIIGSDLLRFLNYARGQLAKALAGNSEECGTQMQSIINRKLILENQVHDVCAVGVQFDNNFDYLLASFRHSSSYKRFERPSTSVIVGVGSRPYISCSIATKASEGTKLNDALWAVTKEFISSYLPKFGRDNKATTSQQGPPPAPSENIKALYKINDLLRSAISVTCSPNRRILAIIDTFGRVALFDVKRYIIFRMFKGYRDGQCGFLEVNEDESKKFKENNRKTLFVVFYDGKRGLLEVWPMHGPRIAAFKVTSNSQLIYNPHGIIMYNESKPVKRNSHGSLLLLMDPNGQLKEIIVPFHFSMAYENSDRAKDVHIVKKLRQFIKEKKLSYEELENEVISVVKELKTIDVKIYILEMLLSIKKIPPTIILECIKKFEDDVPNEEKANNKLIILCSNLTALLQIYILVHADGKNYIDDKENACESLLSEPQIEKFESLLNYAASLQHKRTAILQKVSFQDEVEHAYSDFIMCFDIYSTNEYLSIKNEASLETLNYLSQQLFENFIKGTHCCKALLIELQKYKSFTNYDLVKLLIIYFTNIPIQEIDKNKIINFEKVLYELCEIEGFNIISKSYNETSPWWYFIREVLINASCPFRSMVTAELCRAVAIQIEKQVDNGQSEIDETTWETMSKDRAQWGMLIGKLDDISLLSIILSQKQEQIKEVPTLPIDVPEINLKYIYTNGRGSISEIIAKWLCIAGISPKTVATQSDINDNKEIELKTHVINKTISTYDKLSVLRKQFPFSLHPDSVITYMCWEYSKAWFKNIQDVQFLHTIVECLNYITNIPMRCGICFMIWSTHLVNVFESAFKLISKVGKLPKERLCQQDVQMSDAQLLRFLEIISDFLNTFLCSCLSMNETSTLLKFEPIWDNDIPALTEHALQNSKINIDVLQIHYQLATAIYYQCYLGCNFFKHLSCLFDVQSQKCMFTSLKSNEMILGHGAIDSRVQFQREQFLKVLVDKCKYLKIERYTMLDKILDLARIWRIDGDAIRRTDIVNLFYQGLDSEAEEALFHITNLEPLNEFLLEIAGKRLKRLYENMDNTAETIAVLSPQLTTYLDSLGDDAIVDSSVESIIQILERIIASSQTNNVIKTANMLHTACFDLQKYLGSN